MHILELVTKEDTAIGLIRTEQRLLPATFPECYVWTAFARY
jgi:hypothetical protein